MILQMVDQLCLPNDACVLEVGCGAGLTTVELAIRGCNVQAIDTVEGMLNRTLDNAARASVSDRVFVSISDVHSLHFSKNTFDLVLAIGVLPFLHSPATAIREMARVAKPGGHLIITSDNYWRLDCGLDPYRNPLLGPLRYSAKRILSAIGLYNRQGPRVYMYSMKDLMTFVSSAQLEENKVVTIGFGPFTLLGKNILPDSAGVWLDERLQQLADRGFPLLSATSSQHILLARKARAKSETPPGRSTSP
jgi:ubiquinone/menaquinone biosynthesis C-methylase UbiE